MFYIIYQITNKLNGKVYIGKHQTENLDDGYMGSGKLIRRAIKKYGSKNFTKEILFIFDNEDEMNTKERELVVLSENTYNLCEGGKGGWSYINRNEKIRLKKNRKARKTTDSILLKKYGVKNPSQLEHNRKKVADRNRQRYLEGKFTPLNWLGRKHSQDTKNKISVKNKSMTGSKNSQYGTMWITNGSENRKISKTECLPEGWRLGRVYS